MSSRIVTILGILIILGGCSSVRINSPEANEIIKPNQEYVIEIDDRANASSLQVTINNTDVTDRFEPKPFVAGATVVAPPMPADILDQGDEQQNYIKAYADWTNAPLGGAFSSKSQGKYFRAQQLSLEPLDESIIICELNCAYGVHEGDTVEIAVLLPEAPLQNTEVIVQPSTRDVSLNNAPAGETITLIIPNNDRRVVFQMRGITPTGDDIMQWSKIGVSAANTRGATSWVRVLP